MSTVTVTILSEGAAVTDFYDLISIDISREVNRIPSASLVLLDGDAAKRQFALSNQSYFEPGKNLEIRLRYESMPPDETVFKGLVIRHGVEASTGGSMLRLELKDAAVKLTQPRKSQVFRDLGDDEAISQLLGDAGLQKGTIVSTQPKYPESVQYSCTDWDFIVSRADVNGLLAVVDDGKVSVRKVELSSPPKLAINYGIDEIYNFEFEIDAGSQFAEVKSTGWDIAAQNATAPANAKAFSLSQGNLNGASMARAVGFGPCLLSDAVPAAPEELQGWADARMLRSRMSMIRGRVSIAGTASPKLLDVVKIDGIGERFNGKALVTGIRHRVDSDGWVTDLQFGLSPRTFSQEEGIVEAPAAGLLPGIGGLQVGIVTDGAADSDKEPRIKIKLPGIDADKGEVWARVASPEAGNGRGYFFRPEVGDEVVVGFFNDDPRQPVVLGGMYSSKNATPEAFGEVSDKNLKKGIVTRKGTKLVFNDDDKASLFLETASNNKILLDDDKKLIEISDQHGNKITMDQNGIKFESSKDLKFSASGNVEIKGSKVDVN